MTIDYDPLSPEAKEDPQRFFRALRSQCPVHHFELPESERKRISANPLVANPTSEFWSVLDYAGCVDVLHDTDRFSSLQGPGPERLAPMNEDGMLLFADPPAHVRQRRIAGRAFSPKSVRALIPTIQSEADDLLDALVDRGQCELMTEFAVPLTVRVIARIMGVEKERVDDFWRWGNATVAAFGGDDTAANDAFIAMQELFEYLQVLIDSRRATGATAGDDTTPDVISALLSAEYGESGFTDEETKLACLQLIIAGFETTSTALGSGVVLLCGHPEERQKLEDNPDLIENAVEEILRFAAPLEGLFRTAKRDTTVSRCPIPENSKVRVVYASANRDEAEFTDPERFKVDRDVAELRKHIAFGVGEHSCLGAALARAELQVAIRTLLHRLPELRLDESSPATRNHALLINGYTTVPVQWDPRSASRSVASSRGAAPVATN